MGFKALFFWSPLVLNLIANTSTEKKVYKVLEPFILDKGLRIVKIQFRKDKELKLLVFLDRIDGKVTIDECAEISVEINSILDVESISDKDRNIYDLLVHYYWKKDKNKFESYLSAARSYIDNETRGEHNLDYYLITEGKLDDLLLTANQRFKDGRFNYNFCSNIFISDFLAKKKSLRSSN